MALLTALMPAPARAEVTTLRIARQYGLAYLPLVVMKQQKLVEARAAELGLGAINLVWQQVGNGMAINEALLADGLDIASGGVTPFLVIWDKTRGAVKGVAALEALPMYLVTNRPEIRSLADFGERDRIALVTAKVGTMAVVLQMAAEKLWGEGNQGRLDRLTVNMRHPDALAALLTGRTEISAYFGAPPYQELALATPGIHRVLSSYDVLGGPHIFNMVWAKAAFRERNPGLCLAFYRALVDAQSLIAAQPQKAVELYLAEDEPGGAAEPLLAVLRNPEVRFTAAPVRIMAFATFMHRVGLLRQQPGSWQELFLPEAQSESGS